MPPPPLWADGLDSGESSAKPPHLANISVSVRALTGTNRLRDDSSYCCSGITAQRLLSSSCLRVTRFFIRWMPWDTNNSHKNDLQIKNNPPHGINTASWYRSPTRTKKHHWSKLICVKRGQNTAINARGSLFRAKQHLGQFFGLTTTMWIRGKGMVLYSWSVSFSLASWDVDDHLHKASSCSRFLPAKRQVFPTTVAKCLLMRASCICVNKYI